MPDLNISKGEAQSAHLDWLHQMYILLSTDYSSPINTSLNQITKNWTSSLKLHLKHPLKDRLTLLKREHAFVMELEEGERIIGEVEKGFELATKA